MNTDIIEEFTVELLEELGASKEDQKYEQLKSVIRERVNARLFLDIIAALTPEQAEKVASDMSGDRPDPEKLFASISENTPHLQAVMAQSLATIRLELLEDLKK